MARLFRFVDKLGTELHVINDPEEKLPIPQTNQLISIGQTHMRVEAVAPSPSAASTAHTVFNIRVRIVPADS